MDCDLDPVEWRKEKFRGIATIPFFPLRPDSPQGAVLFSPALCTMRYRELFRPSVTFLLWVLGHSDEK